MPRKKTILWIAAGKCLIDTAGIHLMFFSSCIFKCDLPMRTET